MPIYLYYDKNTGYEIEVIRRFEEYEQIPQEDELPEAERGKSRDWERHLGVPLHTSKWPGSTGPVKGRP